MRRLRGLTFWWSVFAVICVAGLYSTAVRIFGGLGASTGLNDAFPWGIWIGFDVLCGVGLAAGGFTIAAMVYVFRLERYRPILRATVLTAFLGYITVTVSLLFDVGLPHRLWHPMIMWNPHSVMFEVAWCVMFYTNVLALEFSPVIFERLGLKAPVRLIHMIILPLVILGVVLSTLHQSSLGTLFVIAPNRLHGLWYTSMLPVFFFITAISVGLAMTILESYLSHRAFGTRLHRDVMVSLAKAACVLLILYLVAKLTDLGMRGNLHLILQAGTQRTAFLLEVGIGIILPVALFLTPRVRRNDTGMFIIALMVVCGFMLNRLNVSITGMRGHEQYFPAWTEVAISVFIIACGMVAFGLAARYLPVFAAEPEEEEAEKASHADAHDIAYVPLTEGQESVREPEPAQLATLPGVGVLLAFAALLAITAVMFRNQGENPGFVGPFQRAVPQDPLPGKVVLASGQSINLPGPHTFRLGQCSPGQVTFSHEGHVRQARLACSHCHTNLFPMVKEINLTPPSAATMETMRNCTRCHNGQTAFTVRDDCSLCHVARKPVATPASREQLQPPADYTYPVGAGSPGAVTFSHARHLRASSAQCTDCHPARFRMLRPEHSSVGSPHMREMHSGQECGGCHSGRTAFTVTRDCGLCHRAGATSAGAPALKKQKQGPGVIRFAARGGSPGAIAFDHAGHVREAGGKCSTCHPALFTMLPTSGSLSMKQIRGGNQCGRCHNGRDTFTASGDCGLCHESRRKPGAVKVSDTQVAPPRDFVYPVGKGSPGPVAFSHSRHLRASGGACSACHPDAFPMARTRKAGMAAMQAGKECGTCHNGKKSFTVAQDCGLCHRMAPPTVAQTVSSEQRKPPKDYTYPRGEGSPGTVTFSHARHMANGHSECSACHPHVFAMLAPAKGSATATMAPMYEGKSCGSCHNGTKAFTAAKECTLCHSPETDTAQAGG